MWLSVSVKRLGAGGNPRSVPYNATVRDGDERLTIDVLVSNSAPHPNRAESAIKRRIVREINEMPTGRRWTDYLKELEPIELTSKDP